MIEMRNNSQHTFAVCAYKESPYLEECIRSLKNQSQKARIIMVTSTPNAFIEGMAEKYQIPYFVNKGEGGITQDWNFAYACAKTPYITIAHQDDVYEPEYLKTVMRMMKKSKKPLIFFSDYFEVRNGKRIQKNRLLAIKRLMMLPWRVPLFQKSVWIRRRILSLGSPICCPSVTFAANNLPKVVFQNGFRACEDWEAWEMISRYKGEFLYANKPLMGHRIHEGSETSAIIGDNQRSAEEYQMFLKFWPPFIAKFLMKLYAKGQDSNQLN